MIQTIKGLHQGGRLGSVQAVLEQIKSVTIDVELNALKLLDGNADAETLHVANFGSLYAKASKKVTFLSMDMGGQQ